MKYKVGDKVRIVKEKPERNWNSEGRMDKWLGEIMTIESVLDFENYKMKEDGGLWYWEDHMIEGKVTEMKKSDLIAGKHVVETRNGDKYLIFDSEEGKFMYQVDGQFMVLEGYDEDMLKINKRKIYDIMKVFEVKTTCNSFGLKRKDNRYLTLIWEREEPKEMTMAELEEKLGYKVKIVKEHE